MHCPKCGYKLMCGCNKWCRSKLPKGHKPWRWDSTGEMMKCPNCGFQHYLDWWENIEYYLYKTRGEISMHPKPKKIKNDRR